MAKRERKPAGRKSASRDNRLFTLDVSIISGLVTETFATQNPSVSRTIQIKGHQTLESLHYAIFDALDREEEHMYEFQFGKEPHDRKSTRYVMPMAMDGLFGAGPNVAGVVTGAAIGSLGLSVDDSFWYWFDFGDDWWHQIDVVAIEEQAPSGTYPKVTRRVGASPPQYSDWEEEEGDAEDDEEE